MAKWCAAPPRIERRDLVCSCWLAARPEHSHDLAHRYSEKPENSANQSANSWGKLETQCGPECRCSADKKPNPSIYIGFCRPNAPEQRLQLVHAVEYAPNALKSRSCFTATCRPAGRLNLWGMLAHQSDAARGPRGRLLI